MITRIWDITLTVSDLQESVRFYRDVLGLPLKYEFKDYAGFECGGVELGLKTWGKRGKPRDGEPCINFLVQDLDSAHRELLTKGLKFSAVPADTQWGSRRALFLDPDGHELQITQVNWDKYFAVCAPK